MIEGAAHFEFFLAALHMHDLTAAEVAADLLDRIDANHGGTMDLPEFVRVELIDQLLDRLADQGWLVPNACIRVVSVRWSPVVAIAAPADRSSDPALA